MPKPLAKNEKKSWYSIANKSETSRARILIEDEIGGWCGVTAANFRSDFGRLGKDEAIDIHIASGGGSVFEGNEIANIIAGHEGEVNITLGSICASIATVVAVARGKSGNVKAARNTLFMMHNPEVYSGGDSGDHRKAAEIMDKMKSNIVKAYAAKTGLGEDKLAEMMDEETWLDADEALAMGFVNEIDSTDAEDDVVDNVELSHYSNSAGLLFKLQAKGKSGETDELSGNAKRAVTLASLGIHAKNQTKPTPATAPNSKTTMSDEEKRQLEIQNAAKELRKLSKDREKTIRNHVATILKQDGKDFSEIQDQYLEDETLSLADFYRDCATSTKFKAVSGKKPGNGAPVIGAGEESAFGHGDLIEPLDSMRGTPGHAFVCSERMADLRDQISRHGTHQSVAVNVTLPRFRNVQTSTATSGSGLTSIDRVPGLIDLGVRPLTVEDLVAPGQTTGTTIRDIQEVTYTQAAAAVTEVGTLAEFTVTYTEVDFPVKDIGGFIVTSENLLADYLAVASLINQRVPYQVDRAVDDQLMNGTGAGAQLTGLLNTAGIQTLALGANTRADLLFKLQTLVRWQAMGAGAAQGGFEPDGYVMHPTDWETINLVKDSAGQYLCKGPFVGSYGSPDSAVEFYTVWGKKVAVSPVIAQGTVLCGAFKNGAQKFDRQGMSIEMTNANGTDFTKRQVTIRGTRRLALAVYRPGCFVQGTGF